MEEVCGCRLTFSPIGAPITFQFPAGSASLSAHIRSLQSMDTFYQVFVFVAALCAGIIMLTVFFTAVGYFKRATRGFDVVKLKGFIKDGKLINVYLSGGKSVLGVRFVGFTDQSAGKSGVPYQFSSMVVLETTKGARVLIRADSVRMIEEVEDVS